MRRPLLVLATLATLSCFDSVATGSKEIELEVRGMT
jgi:hypothetical protein